MAVAPLNFHRRPLARLRCSRLRAAKESAKKVVLRSPSAAVFIATALLTGCGASGPLAEACAEVGDRWACKDAYLFGANLSGADLAGADLLNVDLREADLAGADLTGACLGEDWVISWEGMRATVDAMQLVSTVRGEPCR